MASPSISYSKLKLTCNEADLWSPRLMHIEEDSFSDEFESVDIDLSVNKVNIGKQ